MYKYQYPRLTRIFLTFIFILLSTSANAELHSINASNFTILDPTGFFLIGGATDVNGSFEDTLICSAENCTDISMTLASNQALFGEPWTAHDIRVYGPGSYIFDTDCTGADIATGITNCGNGPYLNLTVGPNQLGAHMLLDWAIESDFDVAVLWDYNGSFGTPIFDGSTTSDPGDDDLTQTPTRIWYLVSRDGDTSGVQGIAMVDGPFPGSYANFNLDIGAPPIANDDNRSVLTDIPIIIDVVNNDTDVEDGSPLPVPPAEVSADAVSNQGFTITNNGDGTVTYAPTGGFTGTDTFQYSLLDSDGLASASPATVTVTVSDVANQLPVASDPGDLNTDEDTALLIGVNTVAADADAGPNPLTFHLFDANTLQGGTVTADDPQTTLTYTPPADFFGNDSLIYQVTDGADDSNVATLTIAVNSVNDPLVCTDVSFVVDTNTSFDIDVANDLLSTCTDTDNDPISLDSFTQPVIVGSMVTFDGNNTLTYTPATDYEGLDSFTYRATDGTDFDVHTVTLTVRSGGDGSSGFVLKGVDAGDLSGYSVSGAGDLNGDGIDDLIIGADGADPNGNSEAGESYVVFGRTTGFPAAFELTSLFPQAGGDGSSGFVLKGVDADDHSGVSVSGAGDVNGDGIDDLIIGASGADPNNNSEAGESYVVFGRTTGFPAAFELTSLFPQAGGDGSSGFVLKGVDATDFSGWSVSGAGDVNGDGIDDLIIGAYDADPNGKASAGESYVVFGRATGFPAAFELTSLFPQAVGTAAAASCSRVLIR